MYIGFALSATTLTILALSRSFGKKKSCVTNQVIPNLVLKKFSVVFKGVGVSIIDLSGRSVIYIYMYTGCLVIIPNNPKKTLLGLIDLVEKIALADATGKDFF